MRLKSVLLIPVILLSCGQTPSTVTTTTPQTASLSKESKLLQSVTPSYKETFAQGELVKFAYKTDGVVDSVRIVVDGNRVTGEQMQAQEDRVGRVAYRVTAFKGDENHSMDGEFLVVARNAPKVERIKIKKSYPHSTNAYTQGLLFHDGKLYESTGQYGASSLRMVDVSSGKVLKNKDLDEKYFGEGLALLNGKLYQLTWEEGVVFVYDLQTFELVKEYKIAGEGWGVTTDGTHLYVADGTHRISKYDPDGFRKMSQIEVVDNKQRVTYLNELEWINGKIWANIYTSNIIAVINPKSGVVERYIDCSELVNKIGNASSADVLNGIAHDPKTGRIWLTGKEWDKLFEVTVE